jgi:3-oxoadipate enol-lactonase
MPWTETAPKLHYELTGAGEPRLVLIHEMGGSLTSWSYVADLLADEFSILSYDQRGAGLSEKPPGAIDPSDHVDDLEAVLQAAGWSGPLLVAGAAAGSAVALGYQHRHPEAVARLALCVPSIESTAAQLAAAKRRAEVVRRDGMRGLLDGAMAATYPEEIRDERYPEYRARWLAHDPHAFAELNLAFCRVAVDPARVTVPCLVLAGERDRARTPESARALAVRFRLGSCDTVPHAAHLMAVQAPGEVAPRLRRFFTGKQTLTVRSFMR